MSGEKVFVIGQIEFDLGSEEQSGVFREMMQKSGHHSYLPSDMANFLNQEGNKHYAKERIWTLCVDGVSLYSIGPSAHSASWTLLEMATLLSAQEKNDIKCCVVAGIVTDEIRLHKGHEVPTIAPVHGGLIGWKTNLDFEQDGFEDFENRIFYELRNRGLLSAERAMNFTATHANQLKLVFEDAFSDGLFLNQISTERSPISRPNSDLWDVIFDFFNPKERMTKPRKLYRFTVDVSNVMPVTVGKMRSWYSY